MWKGIMIHHSATPDTAKAETEDFRRYHQNTRGWLDIGYNFVVEKIGKTYQVLCGRPLHVSGAHCPGKNRTHLGVCLVGNFETQEPEIEQLEVAARYVAGLCETLRIPVEAITQHGDHRQTKCPGGKFNLERFRGMVAAMVRSPYPVRLE